MNKTNYARFDNGKLEIHTDNATFLDGKTHTSIVGKTFEISGEDFKIAEKRIKEAQQQLTLF